MKKVISMVLAVLMLLSLVACGEKAPDKVEDSYPGTWEIDHLTIDGVTYAKSELEALGDYRSHALLVIKEGGQAYAAESGENGVIIAWSEIESGILLDDDIHSKKDMFRILLSNHGDYNLQKDILTVLAEKLFSGSIQSPANKSLLKEYIFTSTGSFGMIYYWLMTDTQADTGELTEQITQYCLKILQE